MTRQPVLRMRRRIVLATLLALAAAAATEAAEPFPTKPVKILVPYPAGGAVDIVARTLGQKLSEGWGQPVVVDNRPGAGGTIATQVVAKAPPDGYTLIIVASGHALNPLLYASLPYDTFKDFSSITELGYAPNMLLVRSDSPFRSVADLVAAARAKPGSLSYGMAGVGTSTHLAGELFKHLARVDIVGVPYKGGAPVLNDLIGGQLPMSFNNVPESIGQIRAGAVRPLGVTTKERSPALPEVPSIAEAGVPGYDTSVWWALIGPAGIAREVVEQLHRETVAALADPAIKQRFAELGAVAVGGTPEELDRHIRADMAALAPVVKAANIRAE
jgi:tripartite-type tricarboxylate transporter receptor subunit TctC